MTEVLGCLGAGPGERKRRRKFTRDPFFPFVILVIELKNSCLLGKHSFILQLSCFGYFEIETYVFA
jgi:hypothetical protein